MLSTHHSRSPGHRLNSDPGIALQDANGNDLPDLDDVLDCEEDLGITVDGQAIRDPAGPTGLPFVGSYYEVFPDHLVSHSRRCLLVLLLMLARAIMLDSSRNTDPSSSTNHWAK